MDTDAATDELYALPLAEFMPRRKELVAQARSEKQRDVAKEIGALRRPTVSAWLVNQLVRDEDAGGQVDRLLALGEQMRDAQAELVGPRMRELTQTRRELVADLVRRAGEIAAEHEATLGASGERELEETLTAAVADEPAAQAVASGRLTRALVYAGFGDVDVTAATATPIAAPRRLRVVRDGERKAADDAPQEREKPKPDPAAQRRREEAERAAQQAQSDVEAAEAEATGAAGRREAAEAAEEEAVARVEELERELERARGALAAAEDEVAAAAKDQRRLERAAREAHIVLQRAERRRSS